MPRVSVQSQASVVSTLAAQRMSDEHIAAATGLDKARVQSIRWHASKRGFANPKCRAVVFEERTFRALAPLAEQRGLSVRELVVRIVDKVTVHGIAGDVLDRGLVRRRRQRKIAP